MCYVDAMHGDAAEETTGDAMNTSQLQCAVGGDANRRKISVVLHIVFLQLGENVLAVRVLAEYSDMRTDLVDEQFALRWIGDVNHTLYHVVGKLVFHHCIQCRLWPTACHTHYLVNLLACTMQTVLLLSFRSQHQPGLYHVSQKKLHPFIFAITLLNQALF